MPREEIQNRTTPDYVPLRDQGDVPVIARLILKNGGEVWRPATAHRWTEAHIHVSFHGRGDTAWLRAEDVVQEIHGPLQLRRV